MKRTDAAAIALLALCLAALLARLTAAPAMSLDEAWIGLFADRLRRSGLYSPHQMNHYTGPLYARLIAAFYDARGLSLESLRLPGALLGAAALAGAWAHLRRRAGAEAGLWWALLAAGSAYSLTMPRLAWEVYALHPVLILGTAAAVAAPGRGVLLVALTWLGVQNHFIYLSVPASLVLLFGARAAWRGEREAVEPLRDALAALAAGVALALLKQPLTDEFWVAHRLPLAAALTLVPAAAALAARRAPETLLLLPLVRARKALSVLLTLAAVAFVVWHLVPMAQIFAGPVVFKRLFAYPFPLGLSLLLHAWGAFLAALLLWNAVRAWHAAGFGFHERTLALWPVAYAPVFVFFRNTSSLRYYSLPLLLALLALSVALPRLARADKRGVALCALAAALVTQVFLWREIVSPADRRPLNFRIGWRRENSKDFARKEGLFAAYDASGACEIAHAERSFTAIPLFFHRAQAPVPGCDARLAFDSDQCPECARAPFYRWTVVPAAK